MGFKIALKNVAYRFVINMAIGYFMVLTGFLSIYFLVFSIPIILVLNIIYLYLSDKAYLDVKLDKRKIVGLFLVVIMFFTLSTGFTYRNRKQPIPVLTYHRINNESLNGSVPTVTIESFRNQMDFLKKHGYSTITAEELYSYYMEDKKTLPKKPVVITFDDGWNDNYTNAYPILKENNFKATVFLITGRIETKNYLTWDEIREMKDYGITFGGHTKNHVNLKKFSSEEAYDEIRESYEAINLNLGVKPESFCYPYGGGDLSRKIQKLVENAGFKIAFASHNYGINIGKVNMLAIRRILIPRFRILHKPQLVFSFW